MRREPNFFAFAFGVVYTIFYLVLPFYQVTFISINGWNLMQINAVMVLPLAFGILMILSSLMLDIRISIGIGALTLLTSFILMLIGRNILLNGNALTSMANNLFSNITGYDLSYTITIAVGVGAILMLMLATVYIVAELILMNKKSSPIKVDDDIEW